ncbi:MAG: hypothetical protein GY807_06130, partial [Gammaproteobacteria bacterium]|nr:hypothetical protein [Gammaproteobacteria bacterium]
MSENIRKMTFLPQNGERWVKSANDVQQRLGQVEDMLTSNNFPICEDSEVFLRRLFEINSKDFFDKDAHIHPVTTICRGENPEDGYKINLSPDSARPGYRPDTMSANSILARLLDADLRLHFADPFVNELPKYVEYPGTANPEFTRKA